MNIRAKVYGGANAADEPILQAKKPKGAKADALNSIAVARDTRHRSNNRTEDRHRLSSERARIRHKRADHEVELINLSGGGAMVTGPFKPMLWDRVELHLGEHGTIECAVRWLRDGRIGLEFAQETRLDCPADEVASVLRDVITRSFPGVEFADSDEPLPFEPAPPTEDELRGAPRHPLIWSGVLHHDYQSTPVRIRNISSTGAMIEPSMPVRVGAQPLLELGDEISVSATVQWTVGDQVGLRFQSPFDLKLLADAKPTEAPAHWSPPSYLEMPADRTEDPASKAHWGRLTLSQLNAELAGFLKH
jgi:PilZ domain